MIMSLSSELRKTFQSSYVGGWEKFEVHRRVILGMHLFYRSIPQEDGDLAREAVDLIVQYAYEVEEDFLMVVADGLEGRVYKFPEVIQKHISKFKAVIEYIIKGDSSWEESLPPRLIEKAEELSLQICKSHLEELLEIPLSN